MIDSRRTNGQAERRADTASVMLQQAARFGCVGLVATLVHASLFAAIAGNGLAAAHIANVLAFTAAFAVSFLGHSVLTFGTRPSLRQLFRFLIVAISGLALNALIVEAVTNWFALDYRWCLPLMVFVVPPITFLLSRYWAFQLQMPAQ